MHAGITYHSLLLNFLWNFCLQWTWLIFFAFMRHWLSVQLLSFYSSSSFSFHRLHPLQYYQFGQNREERPPGYLPVQQEENQGKSPDLSFLWQLVVFTEIVYLFHSLISFSSVMMFYHQCSYGTIELRAALFVIITVHKV